MIEYRVKELFQCNYIITHHFPKLKVISIMILREARDYLSKTPKILKWRYVICAHAARHALPGEN